MTTEKKLTQLRRGLRLVAVLAIAAKRPAGAAKLAIERLAHAAELAVEEASAAREPFEAGRLLCQEERVSTKVGWGRERQNGG